MVVYQLTVSPVNVLFGHYQLTASTIYQVTLGLLLGERAKRLDLRDKWNTQELTNGCHGSLTLIICFTQCVVAMPLFQPFV